MSTADGAHLNKKCEELGSGRLPIRPIPLNPGLRPHLNLKCT